MRRSGVGLGPLEGKARKHEEHDGRQEIFDLENVYLLSRKRRMKTNRVLGLIKVSKSLSFDLRCLSR